MEGCRRDAQSPCLLKTTTVHSFVPQRYVRDFIVTSFFLLLKDDGGGRGDNRKLKRKANRPLRNCGIASGRGFWARISRLASCWCFRTLPPEVGPSRCKCTSPQRLPRSTTPGRRLVSQALQLPRLLSFAATFPKLTLCADRRPVEETEI